ncbi:ABC transporter permease [Thermus tengchongensis]|uniref:ABC transporter permease subunit n=1 Tax=Thermus tengchongensis TaxID=1214928 RepID=A0A4Y9FBN6_9DEIN|nr:ABC transporter permease subunit [Thermus tengchongensis]TFU26545.1 ABC transporter permease subunit [Thermus tengchongensis]
MRALGWLFFLLFLLYLLLPMLAPVVYSFSRLWLGVLPEGFTLEGYARILRDPEYLEAALLSLRIALLAVLLNVLVGVPTAYVAHLWAGRGGEGLRRLLQVLPLLVPPLVVGLGFLLAFNRPPLALSGTLWIVVLGHAALGFPFFFRTVYAGLAGLEVRLLMEAAQASGAGLGARLRYVLLPNLLPAVLSGALVAFAISMGEFEVTSMVAGFGTITLPLLLFQSLREDFRSASAVASALLYVTLLALVGLTLLRRR